MKVHGKAALVVIDADDGDVMAQDAGIPVMDGAAERHARILELVECAPAAGVAVVFVSEGSSAFDGTESGVVRSLGARTLILVGALTDVCVHLTFVDAHGLDYHCRVVDDCVGGSSQAASDAALQAMVSLQRDCRVDSNDVLAAFAAMRVIAAGR